MRIGIPRETKDGERRVALLPDAIRALVNEGHAVTVERGAGLGIGIADRDYEQAGACVSDAAQAWGAELVVKVKEVLERDLPHIPKGAAIFSFHQLVGEPRRTRWLVEREATAIAFERVREGESFPLLAPMSVIAGRLGVENGVRFLGRMPERVLVLGAGKAGLSAARAAADLGAHVTVLTRSGSSRDAARAEGFEAEVAHPPAVERHALTADLVVGAVLVVGQPTPKLLARSLVRRMKPGAVIADVCIDGGGVSETSRPTSHSQPTYVDEGVTHYCVPNIPAAAPAEASAALSAAALPYVHEMASKGIEPAVRGNPALRAAVLLWRGEVAHPDIAKEAGLPYTFAFGPQTT